jgi:hypothetical protein
MRRIYAPIGAKGRAIKKPPEVPGRLFSVVELVETIETLTLPRLVIPP